MQAINLKTNHLSVPFGMDAGTMFLSWQCTDGVEQTAYEIEVTVEEKMLWSSAESEFLCEVLRTQLEAFDWGIVHPVAMAFQNDGRYIHGKSLCHQAVQVHVAGAKLHAVGLEDGRHSTAGKAHAAVIDVPQLHPGAKPLHPCKRIGTTFCEPVAVKLKVDKFGVCFLD